MVAGSITLAPQQSREPGWGLLPPQPWVSTSRGISSTLLALHPHFLLNGFHTIKVLLCSSACCGELGFHFLENLHSWPCYLSGHPHPSTPLPGDQSLCASSSCIPGGLGAAGSPQPACVMGSSIPWCLLLPGFIRERVWSPELLGRVAGGDCLGPVRVVGERPGHVCVEEGHIGAKMGQELGDGWDEGGTM